MKKATWFFLFFSFSTATLSIFNGIRYISSTVPREGLWAPHFDKDSVTGDTGEKQIPARIPVFYNVYTNPAKVSLSVSIVHEQISQLLPEHDVFVRSIGAPIQVENATLIRHDERGDEIGTLELLWQHCKIHTADKVVYIHNKGSFHPRHENNVLRKFLTRGALSQECMDMPSSCNVCSSRMSPLPNPHTSGNMWIARCEYIQKLVGPSKFDEKMRYISQKYYKGKRGYKSWCIGVGRHAAEHWVHSHPSVMPCDLSTSDFVWDYDGVPMGDFEMKLEPAPRFEMKKYEKKNVCPVDERGAWTRLKEYEDLYNETAPESWWGWDFYKNSTFSGDII